MILTICISITIGFGLGCYFWYKFTYNPNEHNGRYCMDLTEEQLSWLKRNIAKKETDDPFPETIFCGDVHTIMKNKQIVVLNR